MYEPTDTIYSMTCTNKTMEYPGGASVTVLNDSSALVHLNAILLLLYAASFTETAIRDAVLELAEEYGDET